MKYENERERNEELMHENDRLRREFERLGIIAHRVTMNKFRYEREVHDKERHFVTQNKVTVDDFFFEIPPNIYHLGNHCTESFIDASGNCTYKVQARARRESARVLIHLSLQNLTQYLSDEQKKMLDLWTELQRVRKQFSDLKRQTEEWVPYFTLSLRRLCKPKNFRDLDNQRSEFTRTLRNVANITRNINLKPSDALLAAAGGGSSS